ncbi:F-box protein [Pyrus ussuriensis x Pyrus communis]|uniref:F-box protein n=1 Tax=Pyrus ussuriensis x Pyrus communis TaxID=2448454 RepID=A0A5N5I5Q7_9ROSA|nr:F-box protein [Pyrus ussuriensis x Pyrus communis]
MQSDWANLPIDVLSLIYDRLSIISDCVQFMADSKYKRARLTTPMVLVSERKENTWYAYDFVNNQVLGLQLELPKKQFCGSSKGWIITVEANFVVTLMNPQFNVKWWTKRPIIRFVKAHSNYFVIKATISADPISNSKNCVVMVLYEPLSQLAFIRLDVLIEDKIYTVDDWSNLWAFESTSKSTVDVQLKTYLVGSRKKKTLNSNDEWIEKNDLGDIALFVGDNNSISMLASMHSRCINCWYTFNNFEVYNVKSQSVTKPARLRNTIKKTRYLSFMFQPIVYM